MHKAKAWTQTCLHCVLWEGVPLSFLLYDQHHTGNPPPTWGRELCCPVSMLGVSPREPSPRQHNLMDNISSHRQAGETHPVTGIKKETGTHSKGQGEWEALPCLSGYNELFFFSFGINYCWIFTGRTDVEAEALILWPPDAKSRLTGKDPDAGKDWRQEEKAATEDEMIGWHHWLSGHKSGQTLGDSEGQGSLVCSSPCGCKESDMTERLNNYEWVNLIQGASLRVWFEQGWRCSLGPEEDEGGERQWDDCYSFEKIPEIKFTRVRAQPERHTSLP